MPISYRISRPKRRHSRHQDHCRPNPTATMRTDAAEQLVSRRLMEQLLMSFVGILDCREKTPQHTSALKIIYHLNILKSQLSESMAFVQAHLPCPGAATGQTSPDHPKVVLFHPGRHGSLKKWAANAQRAGPTLSAKLQQLVGGLEHC